MRGETGGRWEWGVKLEQLPRIREEESHDVLDPAPLGEALEAAEGEGRAGAGVVKLAHGLILIGLMLQALEL